MLKLIFGTTAFVDKNFYQMATRYMCRVTIASLFGVLINAVRITTVKLGVCECSEKPNKIFKRRKSISNVNRTIHTVGKTSISTSKQTLLELGVGPMNTAYSTNICN